MMALLTAYMFVAAAFVAFYIARSIQQSHVRRKVASESGCEPLTIAHNKLPFGLDRKWQIVTHRGNILDDLITTRFEELGSYTYTDNQWGCPPIICADPAIIKAVLSTKFRDWDIDNNRYPALGPWLGRGVLVSSHQGKNSLWRMARALLRPRFTNGSTYNYAPVEASLQDFLCAVIRGDAKGRSGNPDLLPLIRRLNVDIITRVFCGSNISSQKQSHSAETIKDVVQHGILKLEDAFHVIEPIAGLRLQTGSLYWLFTSKAFRDGCNTFTQLANTWIREALVTPDEKRQPTDEYSVRPEKEGNFVKELVSSTGDRELLRDILVQLLFAGIDTSTSMLCFALLELGRRPGTWARLRDELAAHGSLEVAPENVTPSKLKECVFLQNIVTETLRLYPPVPINTREAIRDTVLPTGGGADGSKPVFVPKGTSMKYCVYVMQRRKDIYGPDALEWNPDRWTSRTLGPEYLPFNGGPRVCIGRE